MRTPATPGPTPAPRELEHTRKQLQELDALLEQMLALPIAERPPDEEAIDKDRPPKPVPALAETNITLTPFARQPPPTFGRGVPVETKGVVTFVPAPKPPPDQDAAVDVLFATHDPEPPVEADILTLEHREAALAARAVALEPDPTNVDVRPPQGFDLQAENLLDLVGLPELETAAGLASPPGLLQRWLIAFDRLYNHIVELFWPFHRLLKWSGTKNLLGFLGVLLLLGAAGWLIAQSLGWPW